jgi:diaminopimelate decarboxylase
MEKLKYQKPYIKKLHAGAMNKFGTRAGVQPVKISMAWLLKV